MEIFANKNMHQKGLQTDLLTKMLFLKQETIWDQNWKWLLYFLILTQRPSQSNLLGLGVSHSFLSYLWKQQNDDNLQAKPI